jgi:hypothetical protein
MTGNCLDTRRNVFTDRNNRKRGVLVTYENEQTTTQQPFEMASCELQIDAIVNGMVPEHAVMDKLQCLSMSTAIDAEDLETRACADARALGLCHLGFGNNKSFATSYSSLIRLRYLTEMETEYFTTGDIDGIEVALGESEAATSEADVSGCSQQLEHMQKIFSVETVYDSCLTLPLVKDVGDDSFFVIARESVPDQRALECDELPRAIGASGADVALAVDQDHASTTAPSTPCLLPLPPGVFTLRGNHQSPSAHPIGQQTLQQLHPAPAVLPGHVSHALVSSDAAAERFSTSPRGNAESGDALAHCSSHSDNSCGEEAISTWRTSQNVFFHWIRR